MNNETIKSGIVGLVAGGMLVGGGIMLNNSTPTDNSLIEEQPMEEVVAPTEEELLEQGIVKVENPNGYEFQVEKYETNKTGEHIDSIAVTLKEKTTGVQKLVYVGERYAQLTQQQIIAIAVRDMVTQLDAKLPVANSDVDASAQSAEVNINNDGEIEVTVDK